MFKFNNSMSKLMGTKKTGRAKRQQDGANGGEDSNIT
jgi:hypothetical protein